MTDAPASGTTDGVFRLIYRSHNRIPEPARKAELGSIFSVSRSGNKKRGVTGALLTHQDWFVQALEGDEATVRGLYEQIYRDDRHERVAVIETGTVPNRVFGRWSMARVSDDGESDIPLLMNVNKGGISPAAPRPTTPEQDSVLEFMRRSVRGDAPVG
jgi:Sensors of blue-light using FAD